MKLLKEDAPPELIRPTSSVKVVTPPTSSASLDAASLSASPVRNPSTFASTQATHANVASPRYPDPFSGSAPFGSRYPSADPFSHPSSAATTPSSAARFNDHFSPQRFNDPFIAQQQQIFQVKLHSKKISSINSLWNTVKIFKMVPPLHIFTTPKSGPYAQSWTKNFKYTLTMNYATMKSRLKKI